MSTPCGPTRITRLTGRVAFSQLQHAGRTARGRLFTLRFLRAESGNNVAIAFSIPRGVGPAVIRNRLRRQGRALFVRSRDELEPGSYLLRINNAARGAAFAVLADEFRDVVSRVSARSPRSPGGEEYPDSHGDGPS